LHQDHGVLYAWGRNFNGQLGDGTTIGRLVPTKIGHHGRLAAVSAGDTHRSASQRYAARCGLGRQRQRPARQWRPGRCDRAGQDRFLDLGFRVGWRHSLAVRADGSMYGWGYNLSGQVGNNGSASVNAPVQISTATNWAWSRPARTAWQ
jgi:alpha-tubulin suppressor-like RCC1 family protein